MKGLIVYKGKYGATKQYADWLGAELSLPVMTTGEMTDEILQQYDYIIVGGSVYIGKWQPRDWLRKSAEVLHNKKLFCFIVCATPASDTAKLQTLAQENIPANLCSEKHIYFFPGRLIKERLSMFDRFMLNMGAKMQKDEMEAKRMLQDFDATSKQHTAPLVRDVLITVSDLVHA